MVYQPLTWMPLGRIMAIQRFRFGIVIQARAPSAMLPIILSNAQVICNVPAGKTMQTAEAATFLDDAIMRRVAARPARETASMSHAPLRGDPARYAWKPRQPSLEYPSSQGYARGG